MFKPQIGRIIGVLLTLLFLGDRAAVIKGSTKTPANQRERATELTTQMLSDIVVQSEGHLQLASADDLIACEVGTVVVAPLCLP